MGEELAINGGPKAKTTPNYPMYPGGLEVGEEEKEQVLEVLDRKYLFRYYGPEEYPSKVAELERCFEEMFGVKHALALNACTSALISALVAVEAGPGARVLDLCCGAGTIPIEAALGGAVAFGGDSDPAAIAAARINVQVAGVAAQILSWDAQSLSIADESVDRIVSNLPWGRAVKVDAALASFYGRVCVEMRRVVAPGGRIVLLTSMPHLVDFHGLKCDGQIEISLFGQTPTIMIFSI